MMFVAISFGPFVTDSKQYWNYITHHSTQHRAETWALEQKCIGGCIGYVVIRSDEDSWSVVDELGTKNVLIGMKGSMFSVQPAPKLQLV